jgi:hypothetical protein
MVLIQSTVNGKNFKEVVVHKLQMLGPQSQKPGKAIQNSRNVKAPQKLSFSS